MYVSRIMKVAIPIWNHRISPVFDTARQVLVIELEGQCERGRAKHEFADASFFERVAYLEQLGVEMLICGAISKDLEQALALRGISVRPHLCGEVAEVLRTFCADGPLEDRFGMPGCCGKRRFRRRGSGPTCKRKGQMR